MITCLLYCMICIALLQDLIECKHSTFALHRHNTSSSNGNYAFLTFQNISSLQQCATKCHFADDCNAFVFHADQNECQILQNGTYPYIKMKSVFTYPRSETELNTVSASMLQQSVSASTPQQSVSASSPQQFVSASMPQQSVSASPSQLCHTLNQASPSGVYDVTLGNGQVVSAYCDMDTLTGGWTVIQNRYDGSVDFYRNWEEYKRGFGDPNSEFWFGNENIRLLASSGSHGSYKLRIEMEDVHGSLFYANYNTFTLSAESSSYMLSVSEFDGNVWKDQLLYNDYTGFSTKDSDNDDYSSQDCAANLKGGWWYAACGRTNLNGLYNPTSDEDAMYWGELTSTSEYRTALSACRMMIRPRN